MKHQRLQLVPTFCKLSQCQFGSLQCLLSQIAYRFAGPSSLMSLSVWPFQTIVRFCEAYYYGHVYRRSKSLYAYFCKAYYHYYLLLLLITTHTYTTTILILLYILPLYYHYYTTITITTHFTSYYFLLVLISTYSLAKLYSNYTIMAGLIGPTV